MFQINTMANFETEVYELKLFDSSKRYNDEKISNFSSTPKLLQAHDSAVTTRLPISWFLGKYHSKMKCFFVRLKRKCLLLLKRN